MSTPKNLFLSLCVIFIWALNRQCHSAHAIPQNQVFYNMSRPTVTMICRTINALNWILKVSNYNKHKKKDLSVPIKTTWKINLITGILVVYWESLFCNIKLFTNKIPCYSSDQATVLKNYIVWQGILSSCLKSETRVLFRENLKANALINFSSDLDHRYWSQDTN